MEVLRDECADLAFDQLRGQVLFVFVDRGRLDIAEDIAAFLDVVGIVQRLQQQARPARFDAAQPLAAGNDDLPQAHDLGVAHGVADDGKGRQIRLARRRQIVGRVEPHGVDGVIGYEAHQLHRLAGRDFQVADLVGVEQDVFAFFDLVTLDDVVALDLDIAGKQLLPDAFAGRLIDLVKGDFSLGVDGREHVDRQGNQRHADGAAPIGAYCHG